MIILGIETSCDESAVAIVENGTKVHCNLISSSLGEFQASGGVIPEQAARKQIEFMPLLLQAVQKVNLKIDAIAVTSEPGLQSSLLVGKVTASLLASIQNVPVQYINHKLGHLHSVLLERSITDVVFPALCLSVSGGHTELWLRHSMNEATLLGSTLDDAIGEAFDKGAMLLGLPYPGGPAIAQCASNGNENAYNFPLPLTNKPEFNFSYSGLKTALRQYVVEYTPMSDTITRDLCASYQYALCNHAVHQLQKAYEAYKPSQIHIVGGVSANTRLRELITQRIPGAKLLTPVRKEYCTDNAAMIAAAGYCVLHTS